MSKKTKFITNQLEKFPKYNIPQNFNNYDNLQFENTSNSNMNPELIVGNIGEAKYMEYNKSNLKPLRDRQELNYSRHLFENGNKSAGRGFGCLKTNEDLRFGLDSRKDEKDSSSTNLVDYQIGDYYFNNGINNLSYGLKTTQFNLDGVYFPRNGIDTRNMDKYKKN